MRISTGLVFSLILLVATTGATRMAKCDERAANKVAEGDKVALQTHWPVINKAPKDQLATIEFWIRPDLSTTTRNISFVWILSDTRGSDVAGLSILLKRGVVSCNVFGTSLQDTKSLKHDAWSHVALTVNNKTINRQARLWVNGKLAAEELSLQKWPATFQVAEMFVDRWNQGRRFSGLCGDVRTSSVVRYVAPFQPAERLVQDKTTALLFPGGKLPIGK